LVQVACAALAAAILLSCAAVPPRDSRAGFGRQDAKAMLRYNFARYGGGTLSLSDFPSKMIVVTFFTTWSDTCFIQVRALSNLFDRDLKKGFMVVGVAMDLEGESAVAPFVRQMKVNFPVAYAGGDLLDGNSPFGRVTTVPSSFVFSGDGRLVKVYERIIPAGELEKLSETML
jgi:peroxiredoxin